MIFSFASIISTGFSSWSIVEVATASVNAGGDAIYNYSDYINIDKNPDIFRIARSGLVKDETIVYKGNATFKFEAIIKNGLVKYKSDLSSISFVVELKSKGTFGLLSSSYMGASPSVTCNGNPTGTFSNQSNEFITGGVKSSFTYSVANLYSADKAIISLNYSFDFSSYKSNFEQSIYNNVTDSDFSFVLNVKVSL